MEARYNIYADELADDAMTEDSRERIRSPLLPAARCQLVIRGRSLHGNYTKSIREAASMPDYFSSTNGLPLYARASIGIGSAGPPTTIRRLTIIS